MTDLLAGVKLFNDCYKELLKMNKRCKLCQNYIKNELGKFECTRLLMGLLSCYFIPKEKSFEEQIKALSDIAVNKNIEAQNAVAEVTKLIQTKYPELTAEYSISDSGIIFIDDSDMSEYYNFEQIFRDFGER